MSASITTVYIEATKPSTGSLHAVVLAGVDKNGNQIYNKTFGRTGLASSAPPLNANEAVFKVASCTKLITTIAALQCVERGLIGLDDSVFAVLPELAKLQIVSSEDEGATLQFRTPKREITLRHLLTHSSGLAYDQLSPLLMKWREQRGEGSLSLPVSGMVPECYATPLLFEPGEGWCYSGGVDWAGYLVRRLNGHVSLEQYLAENIFSVVGRAPPFPCFNLGDHPDRKARLVECVERTAEGTLKPTEAPFGDHAKDEHGGSGLALTVPDYTAVLADVASETPKLLRTDTITAMFSPQFLPNSAAYKGLHAFSFIYAPMVGGAVPEGVNFGLGSLLLTKGAPGIGVPPFTLLWGGYTNPVWMVNREKGVAGMFATQVLPPGDPMTVGLIEEFWKDFWETVG